MFCSMQNVCVAGHCTYFAVIGCSQFVVSLSQDAVQVFGGGNHVSCHDCVTALDLTELAAADGPRVRWEHVTGTRALRPPEEVRTAWLAIPSANGESIMRQASSSSE